MPIKKTAAEECCVKCEKDIAVLRKEVAALKKELGKKLSGGVDPRLDKLITALKGSTRIKNILAKAGL